MAQQIQSRNGTASAWTSANPVLMAGEIGAETDTGRFKIGNGSTAWNSLAYAIGMTWRGTWSSSTAYNVNDVVFLSGTSYIAILAGTNQNPSTATTYWSIMAQAGTNGTNGTVGGSTGAVDNAILRADGTGGVTLQNSLVTIDDSGNVVGMGSTSTVKDSTGNTYQVGYRQMPQNSQTGSYTLALSDDGKHIYCNSGSTATITVPTNASVSFPIGTVINIVNLHSGNVTISTTGITMYQANSSNTGNRTLATKGVCAMVKIATDTWIISGAGVS